MADWARLRYISAVSTDGATMDSIIHYNYSRGMNPVYLVVKQGTFHQNTHIYPVRGAPTCKTYPAATYSAPEAPRYSTYSAATYPVQNMSSSSTYSSTSYSQPTSNTVTLDDRDYINGNFVRSGKDMPSNVYRFRASAGDVEKRGYYFYKAMQ